MRTSWKRLVGLLLVLLAGVALVLHKVLGGHRALGKAAVSAIEAAHRPKVQQLQKKLDELQKDTSANARDIQRAKAEVAKRKDDLALVYGATGMSADEVVKRLESLSL